jgi:hypothetical protein
MFRQHDVVAKVRGIEAKEENLKVFSSALPFGKQG